MKCLTLIMFIALSSLQATAQQFYVLQVKGEVFADHKLLEKRDKVLMNTELTFGDKKDGVRLISPLGRYYITGELAAPTTENELLLELSKEILDIPTYASLTSDGMTESYHLKIFKSDKPYFTTLLAPQTKISGLEGQSYLVEYQFNDSLYRVSLPIENGVLTLSPEHFPVTEDKNQLYRVIAPTSSEKNNQVDTLFNISNLQWLPKQEMVQNLHQIIKDSSVVYSQFLLYHAQIFQYQKEQTIPDQVLNNLIETELFWYDYPRHNFYTTLLNPTYLSVEEEFQLPKEGIFKLVHQGKDTLFSSPVEMKNGHLVLQESDFSLAGFPTTDHDTLLHTLVFQKAGTTEIKDATPLYNFRPQHFIPAAELKKDIKFLRKKGKINDPAEIKQILMEMYDEQYGRYTYPQESLDYFLK